ncbi:biotin--[acetyl-CoA-carboxylase] ligase [Candidatus Woesearchaeota archaeon]|nr:biotin--[acetyl-CoA-carboxylase] ligase [Candidatus Woesearchaeota archaeon]
MVVFNIHHFDSLDSTNVKAREFPVGSVIIAKEQTAGKGRFKREWSSEKGGIYMSFVLGTQIKNMKYLTLLAAIAVQHALEKICNVSAKIKWPNDLILKEKKLCGILTESYSEGEEAKMIIGIGVNTNNTLSSELKDIAISLKDLGMTVNNEEIIQGVVDEFALLIEDSMKNGTKYVLEEWRRLSHTLGKKVRVVTQNKEIHGHASDIDNDCNLIVETADGKKEKILEGDVFFE